MLRKSLRTLQTLFPRVSDAKYWIQFQARMYRQKPFEEDFSFLRNFKISADNDIIDVGANRGQSAQAFRMFNQSSRVHCFEPSPSCFKKLKYYTNKYSDIFLYNFGLSDISTELTLYIPVYQGYVFDGLASTLVEEAEGWLNSDRLFFFDKKKLEIIEEKILVETLDSQNLKPAFIKIDVQGAEMNVLEGASRTIDQHKPVVLIESPKKELEIKFLSKFGYIPFRYLNDSLREGDLTGSNTYLIPAERLRDISLRIV